MYPFLTESRSKDYYDSDDDSGGRGPSWDCSSFLWIPIIVLFIYICLGSSALPATKPSHPTEPPATEAPVLEAPPEPTLLPRSNDTPNPETIVTLPEQTVAILVDDFVPQPYQGDSIYFYNRLEGDRGALNNSDIAWGKGETKITISSGNMWGGLWMSLNHPIREGESINFSAILPPQILPAYQSRIIGITISIRDGTPSRLFRAELKDSKNTLQWSHEISLSGDAQTIDVDLPPLQEISQLVLVLDQADAGNFVVIDNISLTASNPLTDTATAAFVWSYGMLLNNWDPSTGLVRDKAKDASGDFDAIQATGSLAAVTALANQLGMISHEDTVEIISKISDTLLDKLPRSHGLWPHWVRISPDGKFEPSPGTEWSSVDTVIAAIGLLDAQQSMELETIETEQMLREIEWENLVTENGISHGYTSDDKLIPYAWDVFGGESWLVELAYASATGRLAPLAYPSAPTANGSGFIDELAWLYIKPPTGEDSWGTDWATYRARSAEQQVSYYATENPSSCFAHFGLFGLSAAEVPIPARVPKETIYQAFGMGGQFSPLNDGRNVPGSPVITPHYSAMISSLQPEPAIRMWDWLIKAGYFSPLNNVESLTFLSDSECSSTRADWNQLKGSWNLALQALGWGRYLAERNGNIPGIWQATKENLFLRNGYLLLAPNESKEEISLLLSGKDLSEYIESSMIPCSDETDYKRSLPGIYGYQVTDPDGKINYYSTRHTEENEYIHYDSFGWPPVDRSIPPWVSTTDLSQMDNITTRLGTFQALRLDTLQEYHIQTDNHSDPNGTVKKLEWYVCGLGLVRGTMNHSGMYVTTIFDRESTLELVSFSAIP